MLLDAFADEKLMETLEKIDDTIKRHNVRFVRLQFSDIVGIVKQVTIPIELWDRAVENGVWFDGSSIEGFARVAESDMYLVPDLDTFMPIPWEMELSTARVVCDVFTPNGDPFAGDPRYILRRQLKRAQELGFDFLVGPGTGVFPFPAPSGQQPLPIDAPRRGGLFDVSSDSAHGVRRQMVDALNALGIKVEASHHEVASGQNEIDFQYGPALAPRTTRSLCGQR